MADPKKVEIQIKTTATGTGAADAARDIEKLTDSQKKNANANHESAEGASEAGEALLNLGRKTNPAREGFEGLENVIRGGAGSFFGLAKAGRAVFEIFQGASPFGVFITAASLLVGVGLSLKEKFFTPAEEGLKKTEEASEKAAEGLTKIGALQLHFDQKKKEAEDLASSFDKIRASAEAAYQSEQKLADADLALKLAQINLKEKQDIRAAGGNKDKEKEISSQADIDRIQATDQANTRKSAAEIKSTQEKADTLNAQVESDTKKSADLGKTLSNLQKAYGDARRSGAAGGVKSDQENALEELAKLKSEQQKSAAESAKAAASDLKRQEDLRALGPLANVGNPAPGVTAQAPDFLEKGRSAERAARELRIRDLESHAPEYEAKINAGKQTYSSTSDRLSDEAKRLVELARKNPSEENTNLASAANRKAEAAANLVSLPKQIEEYGRNLKTFQDDLAKLALAAKSASDDLSVAKTRAEAAKFQKKADIEGVGTQVDDANRDRDARKQKIDQSNSVHEANKADAQAQLQKVRSTSAEGKAAQQKIDSESAQIQQDNTPAPFAPKGLDESTKGGPTTAAPVGYQTYAGGQSSGPLDQGTATLQSAAAALPQAVSPDHFNDAVQKLSQGILGITAAQTSAIQGLSDGLNNVVQQLAQQKQESENLANQIANQRQ